MYEYHLESVQNTFVGVGGVNVEAESIVMKLLLSA